MSRQRSASSSPWRIPVIAAARYTHRSGMMPPVRRLAVCSVLLVGLLAACGSNHPAATTAARAARTGARPARGAGAPAGAEHLRTKGQALAVARAVNLRARDLPPVFRVAPPEHEHNTAAEKRLEREMLRCAGARSAQEERAGELAEAGSPEFKLEHDGLADSVSSSVSVARTAATTARELAAIRSAHARGCISRYLDRLFKGRTFSGAHASPFTIAAGTPPAPGATGSFGWQISTTISTTVNAHRIAIPIYLDILGFVYGQTQVTLMSSGVVEPFPAATQERLFSLLLARAKAHGA